MRIAAFDLDDTVVDGNSQQLFVRFLSEKRLAPVALLIEVAFWFALNRAGWTVEVPKVHARLVSRLSRMPRPALQSAIREFAEARLAGQIRRDARAWMARVRAEGCHIVLLSASLEHIVALVAESVQADGSIGTRLAFDRPGRLQIEGEMIYGEAKVRALEHYANARFPSWRLEYAFGNDYADRFLLRVAACPIAVCPSPRLRQVAAKEHWSCEEWQ